MHGITIDPVSHVISLPFVIYIHTIDLAVLTDHTTLSNAIIKRNSTTTYRLNYLKRHTTKKHLQPIFQSFFKNNFQLIQHSCSPDPCSSIYPHYLSQCSQYPSGKCTLNIMCMIDSYIRVFLLFFFHIWDFLQIFTKNCYLYLYCTFFNLLELLKPEYTRIISLYTIIRCKA